MESYTLNRLYFEAMAIMEKYSIQNKEVYELRVSMDIIQDRNKAPRLRCSIHYCNSKDYDRETSYRAYACTPSNSLNEFEEEIIKKEGFQLIENVGVELTDELTKSQTND